MAASEVTLRKKEQRRSNRSKVRQSLFIAEYVFYKHFTIYQEAAQLFNEINTIHPHKPDLRKSIEFRNWKRGLQGLPVMLPKVKTTPTAYPVYQPISCDQLSSVIQAVPKKVMQLNIPLMKLPETKKTSPQEGTADNTEEVLDEGDIEPSLPQEGTADNTEEVLDQGNIQPSLFDDISPEVFEELIMELREDPHLASIMDEFEELDINNNDTATEHPEFHQQLDLGMELEIDNTVEKELEDEIFL